MTSLRVIVVAGIALAVIGLLILREIRLLRESKSAAVSKSEPATPKPVALPPKARVPSVMAEEETGSDVISNPLVTSAKARVPSVEPNDSADPDATRIVPPSSELLSQEEEKDVSGSRPRPGSVASIKKSDAGNGRGS